MRNVVLRRRIAHLTLAFLLAGLAIPIAQETASTGERLVKGPVVQNVTPTQATITWVSSKRIGRYRPLGPGGRQVLEELSYRQAQIKGLKPGNHYRRDLKKYGIDAEVSFNTPPAGDEPFSFVAFGDTRTRHDIHQKIVDRIVPEKPSFIIHTGDLVSDGFKPEDWDKFFEIEKELLRTAAFYPIAGNHERNAPVFYKYFAFPGGDGRHYSFDWGNVHFAAVDTDQVGDSDEAKAADLQRQIDWLREDLRKNKKPVTFVFFHHPLYTAVEKRRAEAARLAAKVEPVLIENGVTAVFSGHDHNYQHHLKSGIHFVVTGGGGAPLYDVSPIPELTLKVAKTENYVRVRFEGTRAHLEAVDLEGKIIDAFDIDGKK